MDNWKLRAACRGIGPDLFFPVQGQHVNPEARRICRHCPVMVQCRSYALQADEQHGMWGALTPDERRNLGRQVTPARQPTS